MFDLVFDTFWAFSNFMCLAGAVVFFAIGGLMIAGWATSRFSYKRYQGTIVGVVEKESRLKNKNGDTSTIYYPLVEYIDESGTTVRARMRSGSSLLSNKKPGKTLSILVDPKDPENIQPPGIGLLIGGILIGLPGILFLKFFFRGFEFNAGTVIGFAAAFALIGVKGAKFIKSIRRDKPLTVDEFQAQLREKRKKENAGDAARVLNAYQVEDRIETGARQRAKAAPFVMLAGLAMLCGGAYWAYSLNAFMQDARPVEGRVIDMKDSYSDGSYTYYAVVEFEKPGGGKSSFTDNIGTNPPSYERGENVTVLYSEKFPYKPMIDRGVWNWAFQAGLCIIGLLVLAGGLAAARRQNSKAL